MQNLKDLRQGKMSKTKPKKTSTSKSNLYLDIGLAALFVIVMEVYFTGVPIHEWLGLLLAILLVVHFIWHWRWVVQLTRTFFKKLLHESRLNYLLNAFLLFDMITLIVSGLVLSSSLGFKLTLGAIALLIWQTVHALTAQFSLILAALHIALHWRWIIAHTRKYIFQRSHHAPQEQVGAAPAPLRWQEKHSHE